MNKTTYIASPGTGTERLDAWTAVKSGLSRSHVQRLIKQGLLTVNSRREKPNYRVKAKDLIELTLPDEPASELIPEDIPLDVIMEDEYIIVVNKPPGMVVYPAAGNKSGTLLNALVSRCEKLASAGAPLRPGVVHRLDKETSGIMVFARNDKAYLNLISQFSGRKVEKRYLALLYGHPRTDRGEISIPIGRSVSDRKKMSTHTKKGKEAITRFEVIKKFGPAVMAKIRIITGRTHQIRVHFAATGHPVLGDRTYGKKNTLKVGQKTVRFSRQMLHAQSLRFKHPGNNKMINLTAPIPQDMKTAIEELSE
ncbi:MAG TPA: RluA family pseudouridine synthase [Nitrospirae bacterium]|nr:ribosomal large subunit pseudouridine synthase D [bacterium BMS3Abin10]GBE38884.1 ribosomal large subunit pseudouridine synthase D [bacterium BMS3Bbin08]HDH50335.1 RluA family pseudouridine synthase [Nitrospirota bacterium]HDK81655.1 RluA family pseudouridine synthase [Nitrospirota bacterium]HDO25761.1 RluA family pseudouridine synthase [Nitrospirota bacterium]